jgi:hypothetical protein
MVGERARGRRIVRVASRAGLAIWFLGLSRGTLFLMSHRSRVRPWSPHASLAEVPTRLSQATCVHTHSIAYDGHCPQRFGSKYLPSQGPLAQSRVHGEPAWLAGGPPPAPTVAVCMHAFFCCSGTVFTHQLYRNPIPRPSRCRPRQPRSSDLSWLWPGPCSGTIMFSVSCLSP